MDKIKDVLKTATFRQSSLVSTATIMNGVLGLLFYITTAKFLGPSLFGTFSIAIALMTGLSDISDLGVNSGIIRFVGRYSKDRNEANKYLKLSLKIKIVVSFLILIVGLSISNLLATKVFGKPGLDLPLKIAFAGVAFFLLFGFITSALQAYQKFLAWSSVQIGTNLLRLILIFILFSVGALGIINSLLVYILMPFAGFVFGLLLLRESFWKAKGERKVVKELLHFNKWVAAFIFVSAISSRLDTFLSARLLPLDQVGIYSTANQLSQVIPQIAGALGTVIAPKMAGMGSLEKLVSYYKKVQLMVLGLAGLGILSIPISVFLIPLIYGQVFAGSAYLFVVLFIAMLVFLISIPIHNAIIYYFSYPKLFWWLSLGHLVVVSFFGWNLISRYGAIGASFTVLIGSVFNFFVPFAWLINRIYHEEKK